jgi:uncharacterized membrane protein YozB (DUF420 family)
MRFKTDSWHAYLYRWFYGTSEDNLPTRGCIYNAKMMIALIFIIPYAIISIPVIIQEIIANAKGGYENGDHPTFYRIAFSIFMYIIAYMVICIFVGISMIFVTYLPGGWMKTMGTTGILISLIIIISLLATFGRDYLDKIKEKRRQKLYDVMFNNAEKNDVFIIEYIKALFNKYCPVIEWIKPNKNK